MRLGIAARHLGKDFHGPATYTLGLIRALRDNNPGHELIVFYSTKEAQGLVPNVPEDILPSRYRFLWDNVLLPKRVRSKQINLTIFPKGTIPFSYTGKGIPIMLDLGYFYPEINAYKLLNSLYMKIALKITAMKAPVILTISESTRQDVIRFLDFPSEKVITIYGDCREEFRVIDNQFFLREISLKYNLSEPFIFVPVSSISPRKNIGRLLAAFDRIKDHIPHNLVITGPRTWKSKNIINRLNGTENRKRIVRLGYLPVEDLVGLYNLAEFSVYPSIFEGLGLPILEAFNCGCPVVTTKHSSLPEVAGDAAILVNGYSVTSLSRGMIRMATECQTRCDYIEKGFIQARQFSWAKTANIIYQWISDNRDQLN
jgi:glycosyltransferase involved in cell wall biosynthesis